MSHPLVPGGIKVPRVFRASRGAHDSTEVSEFHFYALRLEGVRCERDLGLLCHSALPPPSELPPLFIYPHGVVQREARIVHQGTVSLTAAQVAACEQFHLHAWRMVLRPRSFQTGSLPTWSASSPRHFLLVACTHRSADEVGAFEEARLPRVDEHDEHRFASEFGDRADAEVRATLLTQASQRAYMCETPPAATPHEEHGSATIDEAYMAEFSREFLPVADPYASGATPVVAPRTSVLETVYNGRLYLDLAHASSKTALSPFPNPKYSSYAEYYRHRWPHVHLSRPNAPLLRVVDFSLAPINVLQPRLLLERKKQKDPSHSAGSDEVESPHDILLVPDAVTRWSHCTAEFVQLLRMMPSIMHRLELHLVQWEFARNTLRVDLNPTALRMSLTSGNAQETMPLQPHSSDIDPAVPSSMSHSYERLKFVGDSMMKFVACQLLMAAYPTDAEESLTKRKDQMLSTTRFSNAALELDLQHVVVAHPFDVRAYVPPGGFEASEEVGGSVSTTTASTHVSKHVLTEVLSSLVGAGWFSGGEEVCVAVMIATGIIDHTLIARVMLPDYDDVTITSPPIVRAQRLLASMQTRLQHAILPPEALQQPASPALEHLRAYQSRCESLLQHTYQHPMLFVQSFTHGSWEGRDLCIVDSVRRPLPTFERLEWLGDAALEAIATTFIYSAFPYCFESSAGELSFVRQRLVNNDMLAAVAVDHDMHEHILYTAEPVRQAIDAFVAHRRGGGATRDRHSATSSSSSFSHRPVVVAPKFLADVLEALLGSVFLDSDRQLLSVWEAFSGLVHFDLAPNDAGRFTIKVHGGRQREEDYEG